MEDKKELTNDDDTLFIKAKSDSLRLLSVRPRSVSELKERLVKKKYPQAICSRVVDQLVSQGFLDDEKFAKLFANSSVYTKPQGRKKLVMDLKKKGLSDSNVEGAVKNLGDYDERKIAKDLVWTRFHKMTGISKEKKRYRIYGFLKRRGFDDGAIFDVLKELFKGDEHADSG